MIVKISEKNSVNRAFNTAVLLVYLTAYFLLGLLPRIKYSVPYVFAGVFTMIPAFMVCIGKTPFIKPILFMGFASVIQALLAYLLGNAIMTDIFNVPIRTIRYFVPCILLAWTINLTPKKQMFIWGLITTLLLFVAINTLLAVEINPMVARLLASGSRDKELMAYRMQNIGGFEFCYAVCLLYGLCVYLSIRTTGIVKVVGIVAVVFITYFTIQVQYMTMLLLCIAAFVFVVMFSAKKNVSKIVAVLISLFFLLGLPSLLRWIAEFDVGDQLYSKLIEVAGILDGTREFSEANARSELYLNALMDFLWSPIWGTPYSAAAAKSHSAFLGAAAATGIIGLSAYICGISQCYQQTKAILIYKQCDTGIFALSFLVFVILAFVNPIEYSYELSIVLFYYIPLTIILVSNRYPLAFLKTAKERTAI